MSGNVDVPPGATPIASGDADRLFGPGMAGKRRAQPLTWDQARAVVPVTLEDVMAIERGALAKAFFPGFFGGDEKKYERTGPVAVVTIDGPLMQNGGWFWDGYADIRDRFEAALGDDAVHAVVLKINSPGGMCAGCFEGVAAMRRAKVASGKPVLAYADELAASAAYAVASVADEIWLPEGGRVGSVGVIITLVDQSKALEAEGVRVEVITTGAQKADGHPAVALKDDVIARFRDQANHLNGLFVGQVAASRNMAPSAVLALEAATFHGSKAVKAGLADGVSSFEEFMVRAEGLAKASPRRAVQQAASAALTEEENDMENPKPAAGVGVAFIAMMGAIFGLPANAAEADVQERGRKLADGERAILKVTGKATLDDAVGTVSAWKVSHDGAEAMTKDIAALRAKDVAREVDGVIESGKTSGKIASAELEAACREIGAGSLTQLRAMVASLPVVGGGIVKGKETVEAEGTDPLNDTDREVARLAGVSLEDMAKTKRDLAQKGG